VKSIVARLFSRANLFSIRTRIIAIVVVCILFSCLSLIWYTDRDAKAALSHESETQGASLARVLAGQSLSLMATGDAASLDMLVKGYADSVNNIAYIYILDGNGNTLAHATKGATPVNLPPPLPGHDTSNSQLEINGESITDIASPISAASTGVVHVGLTQLAINHTVATHIHHILLWLILVMGLGITIAFGLSHALTSPISALAAEARELGRGAFKQRDRKWGDDEIGSLGKAFDEMSRELEHKEEMRNQLLAKVLSAQEDERKRIARELHDETSQTLTSLMVGLKVLENAPDVSVVRDRLVELRSLAHQTLDNVHSLAMELRPNVLDDIGLAAAIEKYATEYAAKTGVHVDLQIAPIGKQSLPSDAETAAYRITQEALANVTRHAHARNVSIIMGRTDSKLTLIIEDDGAGFSVDEAMSRSPENKLGLFGMYERAYLVGGTLAIESQPGQGTSVFLEIPLKPSKEGNHEKDKDSAGR